MEIKISELDDADMEIMLEKIRPMDLLEFSITADGLPLVDSLANLKRDSVRSRAAYVDGKLVAVYGVMSRTALGGIGNPWLAATSEIEKPQVRRVFIERTREEFTWLSEGFYRLWNVVLDKNVVAIRWLKWMGFNFDGTEYTINGHKFLLFDMGE